MGPCRSWISFKHPGLALAVGLEGAQYLLPYRAWNVNDAIGNGVGALFSSLLWVMRKPRSCGGQEGGGQLPQSAVPITYDPSIQVSWKRASGSGAVGMP